MDLMTPSKRYYNFCNLGIDVITKSSTEDLLQLYADLKTIDILSQNHRFLSEKKLHDINNIMQIIYGIILKESQINESPEYNQFIEYLEETVYDDAD